MVSKIKWVAARRKAKWRLAHGITPLSYLWGTDRGLAVHRYYLEQFLAEFASDIRGHCLEFQDPAYVPRFGGASVTKLDILHVDDSNPQATLVADLTGPNDLPSDEFDCIVCTHVLPVIFDVRRAVFELHRMLKPGGVLLVAAAHISMCNPNLYDHPPDGWMKVDYALWRFTPKGLSLLLAERFPDESVIVRAYGNSLSAAGEIRGLVTDEFTTAELETHDERFAVEVCARAAKPRETV